MYEPHLKTVLTTKVAPIGKLERAVLSHIDSDHLGGMLKLFDELWVQRQSGQAELLQVGGLWHNHYFGAAKLASIMERLLQLQDAAPAGMTIFRELLTSITEGKRLEDRAHDLQITRNGDLPDPITVETANTAVIFDNLSLTVVGPTQDNLGKQEAAWNQFLDAKEAALFKGEVEFFRKTDGSPTNRSSICVVAEADQKRALFTGDGSGDFLLEGLSARGYLDAQGHAHFDLLKVPHHGSNNNITPDFLRAVTADRYVISAKYDNSDQNPDFQTLDWIVTVAREQNRRSMIVLTNEGDSTRQLLRDRPPSEYGYTLRFLPSNASSIEVGWGDGDH